MTLMSEQTRIRKRPLSDDFITYDDLDDLEGGTFRRVVNRSFNKFPRIPSNEPSSFSVRVVPASAGIITPDTRTTSQIERPTSNSDTPHTEETVADATTRESTAPETTQSGKSLCWQGGRLQSILLHDSFPLPNLAGRDGKPPIVAHNQLIKPLATRLSISDRTAHGSVIYSFTGRRGRRRGRPRKIGGPRNNMGRTELALDPEAAQGEAYSDMAVPTLPIRQYNRRSGRLDMQVQPLLLPLRDSHPPTDLSLPILDVTAKYDPFAGIASDSRTSDCPTPVTTSGTGQGEDATTATAPSSGNALPASSLDTDGPGTSSAATAPPASVRMKSSGGAGDIDLQDLRSYRRLNGYQLFVMVNKRKHELVLSAPGVEDSVETADAQQNLHRKWQAIWSTLPEKTRKQWRTKAKRLMKQSGQRQNHPLSRQAKRFAWSKDRTQAEVRRIENQLARSDSVSTTLVDFAAHFQLLSESFATASRNLGGFEGPVSPQSVETMLLDGLLSCMIPLLALASEEEVFGDVPDKRDVSRGLRHLTYILPT